MMLSEVLIETVILQVTLNDTLTSGIQWVQRSIVAYEQKAGGAPGNEQGENEEGDDKVVDAEFEDKDDKGKK